jgi:hypothetical protein
MIKDFYFKNKFLILAIACFSFSLLAYFGSSITAPQITDIRSNVVAKIDEGFYHGESDNQKNRKIDDLGVYNFDLGYKYNFPLSDSALSFLRQTKIAMRVDDNLLSVRDSFGNTFYNRDSKSNYDIPAIVDISSFGKQSNRMYIEAMNNGSDVGILVQSSLSDSVFAFFIILANLFLILGLWLLLVRHLKLPISIFAIFTLGVILKEYYLYYTGYTGRQHDWGGAEGHGGYVEYIVNKFQLPPPEGWEYHQSAGWYVLMAILSWILKFFGIFDVSFLRSFWQVFNLGFFSIFVFIISWIVKVILGIKDQFRLFLVFGLFSFWPSGIIHSTRITNDVLFYLLYSATLLLLIFWLQSRRKKYFWLSTLFVSLCFLVKTSAILIVPTYIFAIILFNFEVIKKAIFYVLDIFKNTDDSVKIKPIFNFKDFKKTFVAVILAGVLIITGYFAGNYSKIALFVASNGQKSLIVPNLQLNSPNLITSNTLDHYLYFDPKIFITEPFTNPYEDGKGREFFLNYFFKTSLFGEFGLQNNRQYPDFHSNLSILISLVFLVLFIIGLIGLWNNGLGEKQKLGWNFGILLILFDSLVNILGVARYHFISPCGCNQDFRFGYSALIGILLLFFLPKPPKLVYLNYFLIILFIICNILLFSYNL